MKFLPMHGFIVSLDHLEDIGSLGYVDFPSVDTSLYNYIH